MSSKLKRITFEYEDHIDVLSDKDAEEWLSAANGVISFNYAHGISFPEFPWQTYKKQRKRSASK